MVNIIKVRDQEEMTKYALAVVWGMFPTLESKVYLTGKCLLLYRATHPNRKNLLLTQIWDVPSSCLRRK